MDRDKIVSVLSSKLPAFVTGCMVGAGVLLAYFKRDKIGEALKD